VAGVVLTLVMLGTLAAKRWDRRFYRQLVNLTILNRPKLHISPDCSRDAPF
jgi:hypothetical protein